MNDTNKMLQLLDRPAFYAEDGRITAVNNAARGLSLTVGTNVATLLSTGLDAYREFTDGCLTMELSLAGGRRTASVTALNRGHLFTLEPEGTDDDLRMLALAAHSLREPLSDVMALVDVLPADTANLPDLSRGLHRLLRIVGNMTPPPPFQPEMVELNALLRELWDQAQPACDARGIRFTFTPNPAPVFSAVDTALLTRAIHNLLSNSMKFSAGGEFRLELLRSGSSYRIRLHDTGAVLPPDPFTRYLREPGLEDPRSGLGMGLHLVRTAVIAHGGSVLMTAVPEGGVLTELRLPMRQNTTMHSPRLRLSYTGERNALLVELSDVLPSEFYK